MNEIQELVARGRILFYNAPKRFSIFNILNGKLSAKEISIKMGRSLSSVLQDLQKMRDLTLIMPKKNNYGKVIRKLDSIVYDKNPLIKHLSRSYFEGAILLKNNRSFEKSLEMQMSTKTKRAVTKIAIPSDQQILDIIRLGESQLFEFKQSGTEMRNICKEIAAFAHTRQGGIIFYGIEDDGAVGDADRSRHDFDESIQNSVRNNIGTSLTIAVDEKVILGHAIILVTVPPWNRKDVYLFNGRAYVRRGNVVFEVRSDELKKISKGEYIN